MEITREIGEKGQVVIPIDIRRMLSLKPRSKVVFKVENNEVKMQSEKNNKEWFNNFIKYRKKGKEITLKNLKKIEEESYDLP